MVKKIKLLFKYYLYRIKKDILKKEYMTPREFHAEMKSRNKGDIIKEIVMVTAQINKTGAVINPHFKKELRKYSKKLLIDTLIYLKMKKQFGGKADASANT